jgi:hypothetical protein
MAKTPVTTPALKYGPTAEYGGCESPGCKSAARTTCATCEDHFCLGHADHTAHRK